MSMMIPGASDFKCPNTIGSKYRMRVAFDAEKYCIIVHGCGACLKIHIVNYSDFKLLYELCVGWNDIKDGAVVYDRIIHLICPIHNNLNRITEIQVCSVDLEQKNHWIIKIPILMMPASPKLVIDSSGYYTITSKDLRENFTSIYGKTAIAHIRNNGIYAFIMIIDRIHGINQLRAAKNEPKLLVLPSKDIIKHIASF